MNQRYGTEQHVTKKEMNELSLSETLSVLRIERVGEPLNKAASWVGQFALIFPTAS